MCRDCEWEELLETIETMQDTGRYRWAQETLDGIANTVEENEHATDGQKSAVNNIKESVYGD